VVPIPAKETGQLRISNQHGKIPTDASAVSGTGCQAIHQGIEPGNGRAGSRVQMLRHSNRVSESQPRSLGVVTLSARIAAE
jgi:hypothetical protein